MNQLPVQLNSHPWPVRNGYDSVLDRKIPLHRKAEIVLRDKILKPLAVPHGAGHMKGGHIHIVHGGRMHLAVHAEAFRQMGDFKRPRDPPFP